MKIQDLMNKRILIAGYGIEGKSTENFLRKFVPSATFEITDRKDGEDYLKKQSEFDLVIKTPGIRAQEITVPYTTATNIFFANLDKKHVTIGVTGTKGKSTTASLIHHIFSQTGRQTELLGNIGKPLLDFFNEEHEQTVYIVCELSSYQLSDIQFSPHISLIVSLFPDHVPYHGTLDNYYEAKHRMIAHAEKTDYYVYNPAFTRLSEWTKTTSAQPKPYENDFIPERIPLLGQHNVDNIRGAITVTSLCGVSYREAEDAIQSFNPLPHRLQKVGTFKRITFYDDAISTTPESTIAAVKAIPGISTIFLGGEDRGYDFLELASELRETCIKNIVLFPESGARIKTALFEVDRSFWNICETQSMEEAVAFAYNHAPPLSVCLLSTASPSYSLWKNFVEKGDQFQKFVKQYA
ncbi:UDP-N-acetylmuramoyl-L-alanine--D-glutamate ligase [Candidatus Roizmanbacteria bacterium]|nr:MAG: UDP-N-acetylmuramoyl-L-alanine--D-glutamate ligase [Candidatus Roizmanbacteria bacterium]